MYTHCIENMIKFTLVLGILYTSQFELTYFRYFQVKIFF